MVCPTDTAESSICFPSGSLHQPERENRNSLAMEFKYERTLYKEIKLECCLILLEGLFLFLCRSTNIYNSFGGAPEFQGTYHGFFIFSFFTFLFF